MVNTFSYPFMAVIAPPIGEPFKKVMVPDDGTPPDRYHWDQEFGPEWDNQFGPDYDNPIGD